jgi:NADPH2:quinone reductase
MEAGVALALTTQYCTAWYAAEECVRLQPGEQVLVHAAAGGVGTALVQLALRRGAVVYGTAGSDEKLKALKAAGVHHAIAYRERDWDQQIRRHCGSRGLDVVWDSVGGTTFRKSLALLGAGGRMVAYGASSLSDARNSFQRSFRGLAFGIYHPVRFLMPSQSLIGVNMLRIGDERPEVLERCLREVVACTAAAELKPVVGGNFDAKDIAKAHAFLESRRSSGKVAVHWT